MTAVSGHIIFALFNTFVLYFSAQYTFYLSFLLCERNIDSLIES